MKDFRAVKVALHPIPTERPVNLTHEDQNQEHICRVELIMERYSA